MHSKEKIWAIAAAAGSGERMLSPRAKQYLRLSGRRVLDHSLRALCGVERIDGLIVGIRDGDGEWRAQPFAHEKLLAVSRGGESRARTVLNALQHLRKLRGAGHDDDWENDWALVHDAARPCIRRADIEKLIAAARADGHGAVLARKVSDALKRGGDGRIIDTPAGEYWRALTPQMFRCAPLEAALQHALERGLSPSDESAAMELRGARPLLVEGHPGNIKITVPADLESAAQYFQHCENAGEDDELSNR